MFWGALGRWGFFRGDEIWNGGRGGAGGAEGTFGGG